MKSHIHPHSLAAHADGDAGPFSERESLIICALHQLGQATDRQLMKHLGFTDMNAVRPRLTELIESGVVTECGSLIDPSTKKRVRIVRLNEEQTEQVQLDFLERAVS